MTQEIKSRLDQIRRGEVPEGYKRTKTEIMPEDWKEVPLAQFIEEYNEKTTIPNQYPVLTSSRARLMLQTEYYSNRQVTTENNVGYNILPYGYITFRSRSDDGHFKFNENRIIDNGIISYFYPVFNFSKEVDQSFMLQLLNATIDRKIFPYIEGTAQQVLSLKKLGQLKYGLPPLPEQQKIVEILSTQDKVIELYDKKIEQLQLLKKACLQKMFPKRGSKVPEIRFPGFTDDWEQRKFGELLKTLPFKPYLKAPEQDGKYEVIQQGNEPIIGYANGEPCYDFEGTVIFGDHTLSLYKPKQPFFVATDGVRILQGVNAMDGNYLHSLLERNRPQSEGYKRYYSILADREVFFTKNQNEQAQIGLYFSHLDHLITLHQRRRDEEKQKKKALMQLLLSGIVRVKI